MHTYTRISLGRSYSHGTSYDPVLRAKCGRTLDTNARLKIHSYLRTLWQSGSVVRYKEDRGASLLTHRNARVQREIFFDGNETFTRLSLTQLIEKINQAYKNVFTRMYVLFDEWKYIISNKFESFLLRYHNVLYMNLLYM